jgi:quercetin dioxygenase-like cupin family protein
LDVGEGVAVVQKDFTDAARTSNYQVKSIEPVVIGSDVQARLFTLAPGDRIPWHYHKESTDHYFVLEGELTISTREPDEVRTFGVGTGHKIVPGSAHLITNGSTVDCRFLLLQGVGRYDWVKVDN